MEVYRQPSAMEPLLPKGQSGRLAELTCEILKASGRLAGQVHSPLVLKRVADLVREMNCYYSNLIEGHKTIPRDIERAMKRDFSHDQTQHDNQQLSLAHIAVEKLMEERLADEPVDVYSPDFLCWLHREFYARLPEPLHWATTRSGQRYQIQPGGLRDFMVDVGKHVPPDFASLPKFLSRFRSFYGDKNILETDRLVAIAAAHHRLAWIHPFGDGNGRVIRLQSQAQLIRHGLAGHGLWTLSRGLARWRQRYYASLEAADQGRRGDLDGRGNLSDAALADFCLFFLETMLDQIQFMNGLLDLSALRTRVERYFQFQALHLDVIAKSSCAWPARWWMKAKFRAPACGKSPAKPPPSRSKSSSWDWRRAILKRPVPKVRCASPCRRKFTSFTFHNCFLDLPVEPPAGRAERPDAV